MQLKFNNLNTFTKSHNTEIRQTISLSLKIYNTVPTSLQQVTHNGNKIFQQLLSHRYSCSRCLESCSWRAGTRAFLKSVIQAKCFSRPTNVAWSHRGLSTSILSVGKWSLSDIPQLAVQKLDTQHIKWEKLFVAKSYTACSYQCHFAL